MVAHTIARELKSERGGTEPPGPLTLTTESSQIWRCFLCKDVCILITAFIGLRMYGRCLNIVVLCGLGYLSALSINLSLYNDVSLTVYQDFNHCLTMIAVPG